jgi:3-isopropylmalate/(R)-2-methylmalate dehydratase small subunit
MEKFTTLKGVAVPFPEDDINTDIIYPAQFLRTIHRTGLGRHLFNSLRRTIEEKENPDFILNQEPYRQAKIIIAGKNFACGSSREHAVWSLMDFGIRCVIAESFGDIFYNNGAKNGLLLIRLDAATIGVLLRYAKSADPVLTIDLPRQRIQFAEGDISFDLNPSVKEDLIKGEDEISMTLQNEDRISAFEARQKQAQPWLY